MIIEEREIAIPEGRGWQESAKTFWSVRGFRFSQSMTESLKARRGTKIGNLSFNMTHIPATLSIERVSVQSVLVTLKIDTREHALTEWNYKWWSLEMEFFESFLLVGDDQSNRWDVFQLAYKKASWQWFFSAGTRGRHILKSQRF